MKKDRDMLDAFMYSSMYIFNYDRRLREMAMKHLDISFIDRKEDEGYGLKGAILFEEEGRYYLRLHYKKENGDDLYIPKLSLPIDQIPLFADRRGSHESYFGRVEFEDCYAVWGDIRLKAEKGIITVPDNNGNPVKTPSPCHYVLVRPKKKDPCCESETYSVAECACKKERKEFCVVYTMEGEERHVVIVAKDETDAIHQFYNTANIFGLDVVVKRVYQEC